MKLLIAIALSLTLQSQQVSSEPTGNSFLIDSPWSQSHRTAGMQASTPYPGVVAEKPVAVQIRDLRDDLGENLGTSPWLILSSKKYEDRPNARTVWGSTLKGVYKYTIDDEAFEYVDHMSLAGFHSISWNIVGINGPEGERMIVPQPRVRGGGKFLVLKDGDQTRSKIQVVKEFVLNEDELIEKCNPPKRWQLGYSAVTILPLPTGQLAHTLKFKPRWYQDGENKEYVAILDNGLNRTLACAYVDDADISNQVSYEQAAQATTHLYVPTDGGIVKLTYDATENSLERLWKKDIPFRQRTGTTPTMVNVGEDKLLVTVDGKCAVTNVFTGRITCSDNPSPSKIYAVRRDTADNKIYSLPLPAYIETIENSPAAEGGRVVITNYAGYKADSSRRGVASVLWNPDRQQWQLDWENPTVQISGVPTISSSTQLVYGTGTEEGSSSDVFFLGLDLKTGTTKIKHPVGKSKATWDAGNNLIISDDQSMMYSTPRGLARIRNK